MPKEITKVLEVAHAFADYGARKFEEEVLDNKENVQDFLKKIWKEAMENEGVLREKIINGTEYYFKAYSFENIDPKFIDFFRDTQNEDSIKHTNYYFLKLNGEEIQEKNKGTSYQKDKDNNVINRYSYRNLEY